MNEPYSKESDAVWKRKNYEEGELARIRDKCEHNYKLLRSEKNLALRLNECTRE